MLHLPTLQRTCLKTCSLKFSAQPPHTLISVLVVTSKTRSSQLRKNSSMTSQNATPATIMPLNNVHIDLTEKEQQLRHLLLDVARFIDESKQIKQSLELRFAGGWVRDKLLGIASHDIDIAINAMTGDAFATHMKKFLETPENLQKHGAAGDFGNLHKILANPDKSKHLETATTRIYNLDVDFVNLRSEVYTDDSRNPQMEFGTALQDALRRDATINALFYNLHTDSVEDYTTGLADLAAKIVRTPLEPRQTFLDDPLRVLRLIRFASRLGFTIEDESRRFMNDPAILDSLSVKISRERIGVEVEKMLRDKDPRAALELLDQLGLFSTVFANPQTSRVAMPNNRDWRYAYDCLDALQRDGSANSLYRALVRSADEAYYGWLLAALSPWSSAHGGKLQILDITGVVREGLKFSTKVSDVMTAAFRNYEEIVAWTSLVVARKAEAMDRGRLGMAIRRWEGRDLHWPTQVLLAIMIEATRSRITDYSPLFTRWRDFIDHIQRLDLMNVHLVRRLIDGRELARALDAPPGKWMARALDICLEWQLRNPGAISPQGAVDDIRARRDELGIPVKKARLSK